MITNLYESPAWELIDLVAEENFLDSGGYGQPIEDPDPDPIF